ncbi:Platelet-derived growth factor receptor alpha [Rhizoctonia solani]|uniref:Platelet-derived growth factor receptor alpha n=1 Tax=Rhizoctonia solani TaxID=456999 RepID=A0A0K6FSS0_9AGAM|nr:Platelet-derived growth factor receptor alpha [Rhizoctonia solani]
MELIVPSPTSPMKLSPAYSSSPLHKSPINPISPSLAYPDEELTVAEVSSKLDKLADIGLDFTSALRALQQFLTIQEQITAGKDQLKVLKKQAIHALEECAMFKRQGGNLSNILPSITSALDEVSKGIKPGAQWCLILKDSRRMDAIEVLVRAASKSIAELSHLILGESTTSSIYAEELESARVADRMRFENFKLAVGVKIPDSVDPWEHINLWMDENLKNFSRTIDRVTLDSTTANTKAALTAIAEVTGQSLPGGTILDERFIVISPYVIDHGARHDILRGKYFTGQVVAIKALRHWLDEEAAKNIHKRLTMENGHWLKLRHDCVLPFYGYGLMQSSVNKSSYQVYMVTPYLKNEDVKQYLKRYPKLPQSVRSQMALDIAHGLKYMHSEIASEGKPALAHGSLNVYNVLVKDSGRVVISGFANTMLYEAGDETFSRIREDKYRYIAPETLDDLVDHSGAFEGDTWSWGMVTLEILTGEPPFVQETRMPKIFSLLMGRQHPQRLSHPKIEEYSQKNRLWELLEGCWNPNPKERPEIIEVASQMESFVKTYISSSTSAPEIVQVLSERGYPDITDRIDTRLCSPHAIGGGGYGDIYEGYLNLWHGEQLKVAIKCPRIFNSSENEGRNALNAIAREGYAWSKQCHPNVLEVFGMALFRGQIAIVSPWMGNGTILNYIKKKPAVSRLDLSAQVARGLAYLHQGGTIHGDIKSSNILVSEKGVVKIIDFGSTVLNHYSFEFSGQASHHFSIRWAAPELLLEDNPQASMQADVYALGMVM